MLKYLELQEARCVDTPRVRLSNAEAQRIDESPTLDQRGATIYRSATMRAAYLNQDRVDISETGKAIWCSLNVLLAT